MVSLLLKFRSINLGYNSFFYRYFGVSQFAIEAVLLRQRQQ